MSKSRFESQRLLRVLMHRFYTHIVLLSTFVVTSVLAVGCDSSTTTRADAELIIGSWIGSSLNVDLLGPLPSVAIPNVDPSVASVAFGPGSAFSLAFDPEDNATLGIPNTGVNVPLPDQVTLMGTFTLNEAAKTISLARSGIPAALLLDYEFRGDNDLELIANTPEEFADLLGLASSDAAALASVIDGGSIRFDRQ